MNWDAAGAMGEILGALAVVLTLIYLAKQMRQDAAATTSDSMASWLAAYNDLILELTRDAEVARVVRCGLTDFDALPPNDQMRVHAWFVAHLLSAQNLFFQAGEGTMHGGLTDQVLRFTASMLNTKGGARWWETARPIWRPEFVAYLDELRESTPAVVESWPFFNARE